MYAVRIVIIIALTIQSCIVFALPGRRKQEIRKSFNNGKIRKEIKGYAFGRSSFMSEAYSQKSLDWPYGTKEKIEKGLQKLGLPIDKHDMDWGDKGKWEENKIRIKQPEWYLLQPGQF